MADVNPIDGLIRYGEQVSRRAIQQADTLLRAASAALKGDPTTAPVAYSLGVLALEEMGKADLAAMSVSRSNTVADAERWLSRHGEDHVEKLFWALWGPSFGRELLTSDGFHDSRLMANILHEKREAGLYTPLLEAELAEEPSLTQGDAVALLDLVTARLGLAGEVAMTMDEERRDLLNWFIDATDDHERRGMIFGPASMQKLVDLETVPRWIGWLREEFESAQLSADEQLREELQRSRPNGPRRDKWRVRVRVVSAGYSIRPGPLAWWNQVSTRIKLLPAGRRKDILYAELTLDDGVLLDELWPLSLGAFNRLLVAMNIGALGLFWWEFPANRDRFYESARDLEHEMDVVMTRPDLALDWGRYAISEQDLRRVAIIFSSLPGPSSPAALPAFDAYLTGLALLAKSDVHMQFAAQATECFVQAIRHGIAYYHPTTQADTVLTALEEVDPDLVNMFREPEGGILPRLDDPTPLDKPTTLSDSAKMKTLCDAYLVRTLEARARQRIQPVGRPTVTDQDTT